MTHVHAETTIDRPVSEVRQLFKGPIASWLTVIVGPDEHSWRAVTREGPVSVDVLVHPGDLWVLPDGTHQRSVTMEPDRTAFRNLLVAGLTPRVDGHLRLESADHGTRTRLAFDGRTRRRSRLTMALERVLIGDPLVRSGVQTLVDLIAERLRTAPPDETPDGPRQGPVRLPVSRSRRR